MTTFRAITQRLQGIIARYNLGAFVIRRFDNDEVPGRVWVESVVKGYGGSGYCITMRGLMERHGEKVSALYHSDKHGLTIFAVVTDGEK
jgi:hypothetical protein